MQTPTTSHASNRSILLAISSADARALASRARAAELTAFWARVRDSLNRRREARHQGQLRSADICCQ